MLLKLMRTLSKIQNGPLRVLSFTSNLHALSAPSHRSRVPPGTLVTSPRSGHSGGRRGQDMPTPPPCTHVNFRPSVRAGLPVSSLLRAPSAVCPRQAGRLRENVFLIARMHSARTIIVSCSPVQHYVLKYLSRKLPVHLAHCFSISSPAQATRPRLTARTTLLKVAGPARSWLGGSLQAFTLLREGRGLARCRATCPLQGDSCPAPHPASTRPKDPTPAAKPRQCISFMIFNEAYLIR